MTVRKFTVDLWDSLGHDDDVMDIPVQDGAFYTDEDSDAGAFEFTIHNDEASATNLDEGGSSPSRSPEPPTGSG